MFLLLQGEHEVTLEPILEIEFLDSYLLFIPYVCKVKPFTTLVFSKISSKYLNYRMNIVFFKHPISTSLNTISSGS